MRTEGIDIKALGTRELDDGTLDTPTDGEKDAGIGGAPQPLEQRELSVDRSPLQLLKD
jgi:hypothetical protein